MKVPKMYKSSDRYNAGTDVIYNDESKLQYAPFIYATTESGDNGADDGGDEEGEDTMVVHMALNEADKFYLDKTFKEINDAVSTGVVHIISDTSPTTKTVYYLDSIVIGLDSLFVYVHSVGSDGTINNVTLVAENENDYPHESGGVG